MELTWESEKEEKRAKGYDMKEINDTEEQIT